MAAHFDTILPEIAEKLNQQLASKDFRVSPNPALMLGLSGIQAISQESKTREDAVFSINALQRQTMDIVTDRDANHTGKRGDSYKLFPSWSTFGTTFSISMKQLDNNVFDMTEAQTRLFDDSLETLRRKLNRITALNAYAGRTHVNNGVQIGNFNDGTDVFEVPLADRELFFQNIGSMMGMNDYNGQLTLLSDPRAMNSSEFLKAQGSSNATNWAFQFDMTNMRIIQERELAMNGLNPDYPTNGFVLAMPEYAYSVATWIPPINRRGQTTQVSQYGVLIDPVTNITFGVHYYQQRANTGGSILNGSTQDVVIQFEVSVDYCYIQTPFTNNEESAIFAAALV